MERFIDTLSKELSCPICLEIFVEPMSLPCSHHFCKKCIETSFKVKHACPICRTPIILRAMWKNQKIQAILDAYLVYQREEKTKESQSIKNEKKYDENQLNHVNHLTIKKRKR